MPDNHLYFLGQEKVALPPEEAPEPKATPGPGAEGTDSFGKPVPEAEWDALKRRMLADFAAWLDELDPGQAMATAKQTTETAPGLLQLFAELTGLRQDVRLAAKSVAESRRESQAGTATLATIEKRLALAEVAVDNARARAAEATWKGKAEMALDYTQLVEALERCRTEAAAPLPRFGAGRQARARLLHLHQMLGLVLDKAALAMRDRNLRPTAALQAPFDGRTMRAAEVVSRPGWADGTVADVIRQGYELDGKPLRDAEVTVVRNT